MSSRPAWLLAVVLTTLAACGPFIRCAEWPGDEGIWIRAATEMLGGAAPYRDFFEFHPPGVFLITAGWLHAFGVSIVAIRALAILTVIGIAAFTYLCCLAVSNNAPLSAALALIWVVLTQGTETIVSHNYFTTLISLAAMHAALRRRGAACGALGGLAAMITPHRGLLVTVSTVWVFLRKRSGFAYASAWLIAPLLCVAYIIAIGAPIEAWRDIIVFPATCYAGVQSVPFGMGTTVFNFPLTATFPLAAFFAAVLAFDGEVRKTDAYKLSVGLAVAGLLGSIMRAHIASFRMTAPLALPLIALGLSWLLKRWSSRVQVAVMAGAAIALAPAALAYANGVRVITSRPVLPTPVGGVQFMLPEVAEIAQATEALPARDAVFFYPYVPLLPVLTGRRQMGEVDVFVPQYTTPEQYAAACQDIRGAKWVVRDRLLSDPVFLRKVFPRMVNTQPHEVGTFERCLDENFVVKARYRRFDLLAKRGA